MARSYTGAAKVFIALCMQCEHGACMGLKIKLRNVTAQREMARCCFCYDTSETLYVLVQIWSKIRKILTKIVKIYRFDLDS